VRRRPFLPRLLLLAGVMLAVPMQSAVAQNTIHDDCSYCHNVHGGGGFVPLTDYNRDVDLCLSCHDDGAPPTYNGETVPKNVAVHAGTDHAVADTTSCADCHDHEAEAGTNFALIPQQLDSRYTGLKPVVFTARTGANSFADGDATYDGICEVCHTQTDQHRADGSAGQHNAAAECTTCHPHRDGFAGSGGCTVCHSTAQDNGDGVPVGGRRPIMGEFGRPSHHVDWSSQPGWTVDSIPDSDCTTCHDQTQHQQGKVRLKDADAPAIVYQLDGDPAASSTEAAKLTAFCLSCHDADAAAGSVPFSDGATPPVIDNAAWTASSHENSPPIAGCYGDGAFGCHASGHGSEKLMLLAPAGVAPTPPANAEEEEGFCFNCHDSDGPASSDIAAGFAQSILWVQSPVAPSDNTNLNDRHDIQQAAQAQSGAKVECTDCHNPHRDSQAQPFVTDPDPNDGRVPGTGQVYAETDFASEFCIDCHDGSYGPNVTAPTVALDNIWVSWPNSQMGAPGGGAPRYDFSPVPCLDCHTPHASGNLFNLVQVVRDTGGVPIASDGGPGYTVTTNAIGDPHNNGYDWCNTCHTDSMGQAQDNCFRCHVHSDDKRF